MNDAFSISKYVRRWKACEEYLNAYALAKGLAHEILAMDLAYYCISLMA